MYKIGASISRELNDQLFSDIKASGIEVIELSYDNYDNFDFENAKMLSEKYPIELWSLHLPFLPFEEIDPSSLDENKRKYTFDLFMGIIEKASKIGINKVIIHPSCEPIPYEERAKRLEAAASFMSDLADEAHKFSIVIAIEDLPRTCIGKNSKEINYLLSANDKLRACFDTNHLLNEKITDFIKNVGEKIITTHISDYDFLNERHWLPGEGDIDWLELAKALKEINYNGVWLYELGLNPPKSMIRRDLRYEDLYNNAFEILNDKTPTPIGKRIENLGFWG
ncbi:MAG: sugar phosphate isomerase/epimerase [Clostridia bacterium]|nr:sugar phosphate isomerase/epimerase [Clostridia bacterium]